MQVTKLKTEYDKSFAPSKEYLESLPDLQNSPYTEDIYIDRVGIHNFKMPLKIVQQDGKLQEVLAHFTGMVSLEATKHGINMSRILRTAYEYKDATFSIGRLIDVLKDYRRKLDSFDAHILMNFEYRLWQESLRSVKDDGAKNGGWQYYNITFDVSMDRTGEVRTQMDIDFVYSSACPCSTALSKHAAETRDTYAIPHSQRSVARCQLELDDYVWIEDVITKLRGTLTTETLVFCKREDEQAFAELNGAQPKFVEDASRMIAKALGEIDGVCDYRVIVSHLESLHSHDAIAVIVKADGNFKPYITVDEFRSLVR